MVVCFSHGKESGPQGEKISVLSDVARRRGFRVVSIDYRGIPSPEQRVSRLLFEPLEQEPVVVLVGSSMGGYVATVASENLRPAGLFLMAPAFYLPGYKEQDPKPCADRVVVVHGWHDEVVPVKNALRFSSRNRSTLHIVGDGHTLRNSLTFLEVEFNRFLGDILRHK